MSKEHDVIFDSTTNDEGRTVWYYWCNDCEAGSDNWFTKDECAAFAQRHAKDPENPAYKDW